MSDILIVGGGIIGMFTARELALAGASVSIIEQGQAGHESSWAGGGIISPLYPWRYPDAVNELAKWGQSHYPQLIEEINAESGLDSELIQNGLLIFDSKEQQRALSWATSWQSKMQLIDNKEIIEVEPELSSFLSSQQNALWMPEVRQVRNPRLVKAIKKYLLKLGVKFIEETKVSGFSRKSGKISGVLSTKGEIKTDMVLLSGGAWSADLLTTFGIQLSVEPVKGQMILFKTRPETIKRIVLSEDRYVIPRKDGRVLVGSTLEHTGFDKSTSVDAREELATEAARIIPILANAEIEFHWAGLRPGSPDGVPYISPVPGIEGLYVNTGHYRNGVVLGPASARLAADIILNRQPIVKIDPYKLKHG